MWPVYFSGYVYVGMISFIHFFTT